MHDQLSRRVTVAQSSPFCAPEPMVVKVAEAAPNQAAIACQAMLYINYRA
jgi:hypothetical protein